MKISKQKAPFEPVVIVLESREELACLAAVMAQSRPTVTVRRAKQEYSTDIHPDLDLTLWEQVNTAANEAGLC